MKKFTGTGVALVTPFNQDKSVDVVALKKLVDYVIEGGVEYLVVLGTTGESVTLTKKEKELVKKTITEQNNGRVLEVLGIGGNNTAAVLEEIKTTDLSNYAAILSVSPYYNKPSQEGIYQHFSAVARACSKEVIIYNVPGRTGSNIAPKTAIRLAHDWDNITAIKEAAGDIVQAMELIKNAPENFQVISGDDMIALSMVLAGGSGVISVIGLGLPRLFSNAIRLGIEGKNKEAYKLQYRYATMIDLIFEEGNPVGIKELLRQKTIMENFVRLPLVGASELLTNKITQDLKTI